MKDKRKKLDELLNRKVFHVVASMIVATDSDPSTWNHDALMEELCSLNATVMFEVVQISGGEK